MTLFFVPPIYADNYPPLHIRIHAFDRARGKKKKKVQESRGPSYLIAHCQLISFLALHFPFHTRPTIPLPSTLPATVASRRVALPISQYHSTDLKAGKTQDESREPRQNPQQQKPRRATVPDTTTTFSTWLRLPPPGPYLVATRRWKPCPVLLYNFFSPGRPVRLTPGQSLEKGQQSQSHGHTL